MLDFFGNAFLHVENIQMRAISKSRAIYWQAVRRPKSKTD